MVRSKLGTIVGGARVFISYAHQAAPPADRVHRLAELLREAGHEIALDQFVESPERVDWPAWMEEKMRWAERVVIVGSEAWLRRYDRREYEVGRGVIWEGAMVRAELYENRSINHRFVPVVFDDAHPTLVLPLLLRVYGYYRLDDDYERLLACVAQPSLASGLLGARRDPGTPQSPTGMVLGALRRTTRWYVDTGIIGKVETALAAEPQRPVVVCGEPGAGKTQAVAEIVARQREGTHFTLWVDAASEQSRRDAFVAFLREVSPSSEQQESRLLQSVRAALDRLGPALLVLDDLDDHAVLPELLPMTNCRVLVTSRKRSPSSSTTPLEIRALDVKQSTELLAAITERDDDYSLLTRDLAGIPLVLEQAGRYMHAVGINAAAYRERLQQHLLAVLERHHGDDDQRTHTIRASLDTSLSGADALAPGAAHTFKLLALFGERPIPANLVAMLLPLVSPDLGVSAMAMDDALAALARFMIVRHDGDHLTSAPLFLRIAREQCSARERRAAALAWASAVESAQLPNDPTLYAAMARLILQVNLSFSARRIVLNETDEATQVANWRTLAAPVLRQAHAIVGELDDVPLAIDLAEHLLAAIASVPGRYARLELVRCQLTQRLAGLLARTNRARDALAAAAAAIAQAEALHHTTYASDVLSGALAAAANVEQECGDLDRALARVDASLALDKNSRTLALASTRDLRSQILHSLAHRDRDARFHEESVEELSRANELRQELGDADAIARGRVHLAQKLSCPDFTGNLERAMIEAETAYRYYRSAYAPHAREVEVALHTWAGTVLDRPQDASVSPLDELFASVCEVVEARRKARRFDDSAALFEIIVLCVRARQEGRLVRAACVMADQLDAMTNAQVSLEVFARAYGKLRLLVDMDRTSLAVVSSRAEVARAAFEHVGGISRATFEAAIPARRLHVSG